MNARRISVLAAAMGLTLAACGGSSGSETSSTEPTPATETVSDTESADAPTEQDTVATQAPDETTPGTDGAPTEASTATEQPPADTEAPAETEAPTETGAPPQEAAAPEVGGRTFATEVAAESQFDGNPFPDLVVADVGKGGEANLANVLPSDRPILLWAWAPH